MVPAAEMAMFYSGLPMILLAGGELTVIDHAIPLEQPRIVQPFSKLRGCDACGFRMQWIQQDNGILWRNCGGYDQDRSSVFLQPFVPKIQTCLAGRAVIPSNGQGRRCMSIATTPYRSRNIDPHQVAVKRQTAGSKVDHGLETSQRWCFGTVNNGEPVPVPAAAGDLRAGTGEVVSKVIRRVSCNSPGNHQAYAPDCDWASSRDTIS